MEGITLETLNVPETLIIAIERTLEICKRVYETEVKNDVLKNSLEDEFKENVNYTLVEVVYEWALGK